MNKVINWVVSIVIGYVFWPLSLYGAYRVYRKTHGRSPFFRDMALSMYNDVNSPVKVLLAKIVSIAMIPLGILTYFLVDSTYSHYLGWYVALAGVSNFVLIHALLSCYGKPGK